MTLNRPDVTKAKLSVGTQIMFGMLGVLLFASLLGFWLALNHLRVPPISVHGWVAMGIGIFFSLLIGCGLMWLSFYSSREGFDDRADPGRFKSRNDITDL